MKKMTGPAPQTVDEYLKPLPADIQKLLKSVRLAIKSAAPKAEEAISYQIPTYKLNRPLVHFAAFKDHCSFVFVSKTIAQLFKNELESFDVNGRTIHFSPENPLPATLIKKIVKARVEENLDNGIRKGKTVPKKTAVKSAAKTKVSRTANDEVAAYMEKLNHPLLDAVEEIRSIIKNTNSGINERIKWNAPSYYFNNEDMVTFNLRDQKRVHLVFHHPTIEQIKSPILEGDYKGRRMTYFADLKAVKAGKKELEKVVNELVKNIEKKAGK